MKNEKNENRELMQECPICRKQKQIFSFPCCSGFICFECGTEAINRCPFCRKKVKIERLYTRTLNKTRLYIFLLHLFHFMLVIYYLLYSDVGRITSSSFCFVTSILCIEDPLINNNPIITSVLRYNKVSHIWIVIEIIAFCINLTKYNIPNYWMILGYFLIYFIIESIYLLSNSILDYVTNKHESEIIIKKT